MLSTQDSLTRYFRDISEHELLGRHGEVALAKQIEEHEIAVWSQVLSLSATLPLVLETLESEGLTLSSFSDLRENLGGEGVGKPSGGLSKHIAATAAQLRACDRDRKYLQKALAAIDTHDRQTSTRRSWHRHLVAAERAAAESRQLLVTSNLRLVVSMCRRFSGRGLAMEDLIQEGNLGLIKAVDRFEYRRGYRFSTYASWWIRDALAHSVACTSRIVRVPMRVHEENRQVARSLRVLSSTLGREPSDEEIAAHCDLSLKKVLATNSRVIDSIISLDERLGDDGAPRLDILLDPADRERLPLVDELVKLQELGGVGDLLDHLGHMQADVLRKRFGFDDRPPMTLRRIGEHYGLSRERIRQIQNSALQTLRNLIEQDHRVPVAWSNIGLRAHGESARGESASA